MIRGCLFGLLALGARGQWTNTPSGTTNDVAPAPGVYIAHLSNTNDPHRTLWAGSNAYYRATHGATASNLAATALATGVAASNLAVLVQGSQAVVRANVAAVSNLAASAASLSAITSTVSALAYPLAHGATASNLAATALATGVAASNLASSAASLSAITSTVSALAYPLAHGQAASNLAAAAVTPAQLAGGTVLASTSALYAAEASHATNSDSATEAVTAQSSTNALALGGTPAAEWAMITNRYTSLWFTMPGASPGQSRLWQDPDQWNLWYIIEDGGGSISASNMFAFVKDIPSAWPGSTVTSAVAVAVNSTGAIYAASSGYATNAGSATAATGAINWTGEAAATNALRTFATNAAQAVSLTWAQITNAPAVGTGDMASNVFVTGDGIVNTAAVAQTAQAWTGAAATWSTQAANVVTGGLNTARITAAEVTNESNRVRVTAAEVTNEANRVRIVAAEVTNEANRVRITAAEVTNATQEARFSGWTNSAAWVTKTESGTQYVGLVWSSTNYWWRVYP